MRFKRMMRALFTMCVATAVMLATTIVLGGDRAQWHENVHYLTLFYVMYALDWHEYDK